MLETALNIPATSDDGCGQAVACSSVTPVLLWLLIADCSDLRRMARKDQSLLTPEDGLGYWLGIVGGSLMLLLLLYPAGKKSRLLQRLVLSSTGSGFIWYLDLVGPLLILYHCNFSVDAMNSKVAFYSMLAVAISGIIGKYFYARIHRGLYGKRAGIEELRNEISDSLENSVGSPRYFRNS